MHVLAIGLTTASRATVDADSGARRSSARRLFVTAVTLVVVILPAAAEASGFFLPGRGVRPMGRAGAYVAAGEGNLNSLWYNPGNLAAIEETTLTVDLSLIGTFSAFDRAPRETEGQGTIAYPEVSNQAAPHPDPQILIGGPTGIDGLRWAGGIWAPYASKQRFPTDGPQRYTLIDNSKSTLVYFGFALAWQLGDSLRLGAGFQNMPAHFEFTTTTSAYTGLFGRPEDRDLDVMTKAFLRDLFVPTGNVGLWYEPIEHVQLAASLQLPAKIVDRDAEIQAKLPSHPAFDDAEIAGNTFRGELTFPLIARAALRYSQPTFDLEVAGVFEQWSVFDEIRVEPDNMEVRNMPGVGAIPMGALTIPKNWRDTYSIRVGGSYAVTNSVTTRLGYAFETGAPPTERYSIFAPDPNKHVFGAGFTYDWGRLELDTSAAFYALRNLTIRNSKERQINPVDTKNELATIVGNGTYKTAVLIVGTGVNYRF